MTGWVLCTRRRTVTGMLPFADPPGVRAHDAYHRFLPDGRWDLTRLRLILARLLIQTCGPKGSFADAMACLRRRLWRERIKLGFTPYPDPRLCGGDKTKNSDFYSKINILHLPVPKL
jgi:hypothetical protein